jgi:hypothetical protein
MQPHLLVLELGCQTERILKESYDQLAKTKAEKLQIFPNFSMEYNKRSNPARAILAEENAVWLTSMRILSWSQKQTYHWLYLRDSSLNNYCTFDLNLPPPN